MPINTESVKHLAREVANMICHKIQFLVKRPAIGTICTIRYYELMRARSILSCHTYKSISKNQKAVNKVRFKSHSL